MIDSDGEKLMGMEMENEVNSNGSTVTNKRVTATTNQDDKQ